MAADWEGYFGSEEGMKTSLPSPSYKRACHSDGAGHTAEQTRILEAAYGDAIKADVLENFVHVQHVLIQFEDAEADDHSAELAKAQEVLEKGTGGRRLSTP